MGDRDGAEGRREGRRNRYTIDVRAPLRHPNEAHCTVGMLIDTVVGSE